MPYSGIVVRCSIVYGINNDGSNNALFGTIPNVDIGENDTIDKVIEYIISKR